ncbi:MAG: VTC domain-containing protein, partial [Treponemataceae bacterium]|nr:VTC domain-containing protein [Treponemataceae bacterium]
LFLSYDRWAFFEKGNSDFRLTIDSNIQTRRYDLRLDSPAYGKQLLPQGQWLMEAKAFKAFPLWFVRFLSSRQIYKISFSKYGTEYKETFYGHV